MNFVTEAPQDAVYVTTSIDGDGEVRIKAENKKTGQCATIGWLSLEGTLKLNEDCDLSKLGFSLDRNSRIKVERL